MSVLCLLLALLGSYAGKHKHRTGLRVYMIGVGVVLVGCVVLCSACWLLADGLDHHMSHKSDEDVQSIPCDAGLHGCCCCGDSDFEEVRGRITRGGVLITITSFLTSNM